MNYCEPFAGSLAVLLARPHAPRVETVNDADHYLANFWRTIKASNDNQVLDELVQIADYPVIEVDLHARHRWLVRQAEFRERMEKDPDYYDVKIAAWWVWGLCAWIGDGWCTIRGAQTAQLPLLAGGGADGSAYHGKGVHSIGMRQPPTQLPDLGGSQRGDEHFANYGKGVHAGGMREPTEQIPVLTRVGDGINSATGRTRLPSVFQTLAERLRYVRVACGDFERILSPAVTFRHGLTGVVLDPPYKGYESSYAAESGHASDRARTWAIANQDNPLLRIALCGYEGEHDLPGWECVAWKANGGYGNQRKNGTNDNAQRERIWFSPHCLRTEPARGLYSLLGI